MSADKDLRAKLRRLAGASPEVAGGWRRLPATRPQDVLRVVALELDETVLPRRVLLRNAAGEILPMVAGHRRLRLLVAPPPDGLAPFAPLFEAQGLEEAPLEKLGEMFRHFAGAPAELWTRSEDLTPEDAGAASGLSATALAAAWGVSLEETAEEPAGGTLERFRDALTANCTGWALCTRGAQAPTLGGCFRSDPPDAGALQAWWAHASALAPGFAVFRGAEDDGATVLATDGRRDLLLRLVGLSTRDIRSAWRPVGGEDQ